MMSSLGVDFQWVVLATSRACGGAKGSVFKAQARTRAGDANEMRSAVNPPSFPVRAPYAAMKVGTSWCGLGVHPNPTSGRKPFGRVTAVDNWRVLTALCGVFADDEGAAGGLDDVAGDDGEVVDLHDTGDLGEQAVDEPEVPAGDASDRGDGLGVR